VLRLLNTFALATVISVGVAFAQVGQPAVQSPRDPVRVTSLNDGRLRFAKGRTRVVYDLNADISGCAGPLFDGGTGQKFGGSVRARVLDQTVQTGFWYVVMQVTTNTGCNVQGMCGAGVSVDVIWLKFDAKLKLLARQAAMVEDCRTSLELTRFEGKRSDAQDVILETRGGVLSLESKLSDFEKKTATLTILRYDRRKPDRGLAISRKQTVL
jgi:hypothetical protein